MGETDEEARDFRSRQTHTGHVFDISASPTWSSRYRSVRAVVQWLKKKKNFCIYTPPDVRGLVRERNRGESATAASQDEVVSPGDFRSYDKFGFDGSASNKLSGSRREPVVARFFNQNWRLLTKTEDPESPLEPSDALELNPVDFFFENRA